MSTHIYILTDSYSADACGPFKVGKHTGTKEALINRYKTGHPNVYIELFEEYDNATDLETAIKRKFYDQRVAFGCGATSNKSEWFAMDLGTLKCNIRLYGIRREGFPGDTSRWTQIINNTINPNTKYLFPSALPSVDSIADAQFNLDSNFGYTDVLNTIFHNKYTITNEILRAIRNTFFINQEDKYIYGLIATTRNVMKVSYIGGRIKYGGLLTDVIETYADVFTSVMDMEGEAIINMNGQRYLNIRKKVEVPIVQYNAAINRVYELEREQRVLKAQMESFRVECERPSMSIVDGLSFNINLTYGYKDVLDIIYDNGRVITDDIIKSIRSVFFYNKSDDSIYGLVINPRSVAKVNVKHREIRYDKYVSTLGSIVDKYADEFFAITDREGEAIIVENGQRLINIRKKRDINDLHHGVDSSNVMDSFNLALVKGQSDNMAFDISYKPEELYNAFAEYANDHDVVPITRGTFNKTIQKYVLDICTKNTTNAMENWSLMKPKMLIRSSFIPSNNICYYVYDKKIPAGTKTYDNPKVK